MFTGLINFRQIHSDWQPYKRLSNNFTISTNFIKICVNSQPYVRQNCAEKTRNHGNFDESKWSNNGSG
jgi:hypothetical protein